MSSPIEAEDSVTLNQQKCTCHMYNFEKQSWIIILIILERKDLETQIGKEIINL